MKKFILFAFVLVGCYNQKKAQQQVMQALTRYPNVTAEQIRDRFPCVKEIQKADSSAYIQSVKNYDSLMSEFSSLRSSTDASAIDNSDLSERLNMLLHDSMVNKDYSVLVEYIADRERKIKDLRESNAKTNDLIISLQEAVRSIKPIEIPVKDIGEVNAAKHQIELVQSSLDKKTGSNNTWRLIAIALFVCLIIILFIKIR